MSALFRKVSQVAVIGTATSIGWLLGYNRSHEKGGANFPAIETVSAASYQGSIVNTQVPDVVPVPSPNAPRIAQIMRFGFPSLSNVRSLNDYVLSYDTRNRIPYWVCEHLTAENVAKNPNVDRAKCDFHEDTSVHQYFRSENRDYKGSGFDRGHLAAAGNHRRSQEDCHETFLLSNMSPQMDSSGDVLSTSDRTDLGTFYPPVLTDVRKMKAQVGRGFNRDKWNDVEQYCRQLTKSYANVYVCTGPLFLPRREEDGKLYVKYQVIGQNHVSVPTHFYKVVVCESSTGELDLESFLLPNVEIDDSVPIASFHVPLETIERASGLLIFDKLSQKKFKKINGQKVGWF
ncbi:endonuclease G, mitochondrial isoform X1 [Penaeus vannamei]|uniref:endonuclease G, mitochondrial isoform X1 n=1 Tax=Penaeus vannamei TaxID=6689 RepID=UPI000F691CD1|nr:endonuclease G, mitochondrial-like isoform X1 [Penaeus vannamei]XP_027218051.1 endonuclease G, mitochondrial-like isoform X1 [Penaeus vannamei]XP_027218052.1 endonuclease G, mitochondrial-like isoform X1 [Penaeus vannamei]XP_027218053.1 endonuclease G, mitochondrial-like isoform X1 [Penaeus vannamei]XP_027218054.1 endonuclease G, mitochondrial-like isoform X1 [Penaeus vannamei]XP_027218055.1 endonuclease G, mitochondrial-like isoform X1 [Penaeus vannamei]